jgi:nucleotide-binding universal stress UspA family protein
VPHIVVGVDGSPPSIQALDWAIRHAQLTGATIRAITTVDTRGLQDEQRTTQLTRARTLLDRLVQQARTRNAAPTEVAINVVEGEPVDVLVEATAHADLIAVGSHAMTSLRRPTLGTVSLACIQSGSCPVLVIPAGRPETVQGEDLVLLPQPHH